MINRNRLFFLLITLFVLTSCNISTNSEAIGTVNTVSIDTISNEEALDIKESLNYEYWLLPEYDSIVEFINGYGLLSKDGINTLVDSEYNLIPSTSEYEVVNLYEDVICFKSCGNLKYGVMKPNGSIIIEPIYDYPFEFFDGLASVLKNGSVGYINKQGELIINYDYTWGTPFAEGLAAVGYNNDEFWFINKQGEIVSGPHALLNPDAAAQTIAYLEYSEGYTAYFEKDNEAPMQTYGGRGYWGYLDMNGDIAIPAQYSVVRPFNEGLAAVITKDERCIYIDKNGNEIMAATLADFHNGLAPGRVCFIDKSGNEIFKIPYGYTIDSSYQKGSDNFYLGEYMVVFNIELSAAIMDKNGNILLESDAFEEMKIFKDNYIAVKIDGKWGIIILNV